MEWTPEGHGDRLAEWIATIAWDDCPAEIKKKIRTHLLDTLGVTCAGIATSEGMAVQRAVLGWHGAPECTVIGRRWQAPASNAALVNAFHARIHAFDDTYATMHPGSAVVSAALACAESTDASGSDFLAGIVAGYEAATRLCASVTPSHYDRGFHNTGTCNTVGACAAAARVLGFGAKMTADALGFAGGSASGLRQYQRSGSMADSAFNGARAAHLGVLCAQLGNAGLRGTRGILDGPLGFCEVMSSDPMPEMLDRELGSQFELLKTTIKLFPTAIFTHIPIAALLEIRRRHKFDVDEIERIEIAAFSRSLDVSNRPNPRTPTEALLSHQYCAALAISQDHLDLIDFEPNRLIDPSLRRLASRVTLVHDAALDRLYPGTWPHRLTIELRDGRVLHAMLDQPPGTPSQPVPADLLHGKFLRLAGPVLGEARCETLLSTIEHLEQMHSIREFTSLLQSPTGG